MCDAAVINDIVKEVANMEEFTQVEKDEIITASYIASQCTVESQIWPIPPCIATLYMMQLLFHLSRLA